jgi:hypothetical protein
MSNQKPKDKAEKYAARTRVFSSEAREAIANDYINGYTQALSDVEAVIVKMRAIERELKAEETDSTQISIHKYASVILTQLKNKLKK